MGLTLILSLQVVLLIPINLFFLLTVKDISPSDFKNLHTDIFDIFIIGAYANNLLLVL